jgi:hypothetical protein
MSKNIALGFTTKMLPPNDVNRIYLASIRLAISKLNECATIEVTSVVSLPI